MTVELFAIGLALHDGDVLINNVGDAVAVAVDLAEIAVAVDDPDEEVQA